MEILIQLLHNLGILISITYRSSLPEKVVIEELRKNAGIQFDPDLVNVFIEKVLVV